MNDVRFLIQLEHHIPEREIEKRKEEKKIKNESVRARQALEGALN